MSRRLLCVEEEVLSQLVASTVTSSVAAAAAAPRRAGGGQPPPPASTVSEGVVWVKGTGMLSPALSRAQFCVVFYMTWSCCVRTCWLECVARCESPGSERQTVPQPLSPNLPVVWSRKHLQIRCVSSDEWCLEMLFPAYTWLGVRVTTLPGSEQQTVPQHAPIMWEKFLDCCCPHAMWRLSLNLIL